jgi:uncharacterized protein YfaS (alpha-2-macroglobulin family)
MLRTLVIIFALFLSTSAGAAPNVPEIAQRADAYRKSIEALQVTATAAQLLRAIKRADVERKTSDLIGLCEQLVALNPESFSSWLQLGNAQKTLDAKSDKALGAGYQAYTVSRVPSEQVEALLLVSSVLRARLKQQSENYQSAREEIEAANRWLRLMDDGEKSGDIAGLDRTSPAGKWKILNDAKDRASTAADVAAKQIEELTAGLDAIYSEIAGKLPGINVAKLKSDDARSSAFDIIPNSDSPPNQVTFRTADGVIRACMDFTQDLKPNNLSYRSAIAVKSAPASSDSDDDNVAVTDFGTEASGRTLCLTNLKAGDKYTIQLSTKFESKQGATLKKEITVNVIAPDLPQKVAFSGRNFLLPQNGEGEVTLRVTNVPQFGLEIYRITDRALHRHIALGHIGGSLPKNEYEDLRDRFAEKLWSATIKITDDEKKRNKTFRAFLPVRSILNARKSDIAEKIKSGGLNQGPITFWPQQNQILSNDGGRDVSIQEAKFQADTAAFEASSAERPLSGVYALIVRDPDPKPDQDSDPKCSEKCVNYFVQWFVDTDIGLTFYEGDGDFTVVARSLQTGEAKGGTRIELVSAGNRLLDSKAADPNGVAKFSRSITQGTQSNKLVAVLAETPTDFSFLTFGTERLDLSRLNVNGRPLSNNLSAFVTTERGVYQAGETIHALAMIRDGNGKVPAALSRIVLRLEARDRTLDTKRIDPDQFMLGGADVLLNIPSTARAGSARITVAAGDAESAPIIGEAAIQLGPIRPDRARLDFVESSWKVQKSAADTADLVGAVKARYLYGDEKAGAAGNLKAEIVVKLLATESPQGSCYQGFSFGLFDDKPATVSTRQFFGITDPNGELKLELQRIPIPPGTKPVAAVVEVTMFDSSGPLASRSATFPVLDDIGWIGISKIPQLRSSDDGRWKLNTDLVLATSVKTEVQERTLGFKLQRESELYVWEQRDGTWQHRKSPQRDDVRTFDRVVRLAGEGSACAAATTVSDIADGLDSGRFVLTVTDRQTNRETSIRFQTGSVLTDPEQLEPNIFALSVNKSIYRPGETIELTAKVPFDGPMLVAIANTDIRGWIPGIATNGTATIKIPADPSWSGKQFYLMATAYRSAKTGDRKVGPARAIGIASFSVEGKQSVYALSIRPLANASFNAIQPGEPLSFDICIADEPGGKCSDHPPDNAFAVAYVVDEGLLGLTSHYSSTPTPEAFFFGRKRLGVGIMDNYDRLLLKEGGDRPTRLALSNYTSAKVFAADCGRAGTNGNEPMKMERGTANCTIPKVDLLSGAVSIYAVAWSPEYSASTNKTILVRSHVVAELGSPPFLFAGDSATLPLRLENIDFVHNGDFVVRVNSSGPVKRLSFVSAENQPAASPVQTQTRLRLARGQPKTTYLNVETSPDVNADIHLLVSVEAIDAAAPLDAKPRDWSIKIRPPALSSAETVTFALQRQPINLGEKLKSVVAKYDPAVPVDITARFSDRPQLLLRSAWAAAQQDSVLPVLDQLVWRAMFLLRNDPGPDQKLKLSKLINEIQSLQLPDGTFVPYRTIENPSAAEMNAVNIDLGNPTDQRQAILARTATVLDLLSMASKAGIEVSGKAMTSASRSLKAGVIAASDHENSSCSFSTAYAVRVLVAVGMADRDNLDGLESCKEADPDRKNLVAKAASASTFQKFGLPDEAKLTLASFADEKDPGRFFKDLSDFRRAMLLVFLKEANAPRDLINAVAQSLLTSSTRSTLSPAAAAWIVRSEPTSDSSPASALTASDFQLNGLTQQALRQGQDGAFETQPMTYKSLQNAPISIGLKTDRNATAYIIIEGILARSDESKRAPEGALKRRFFNPDTGREIALDKEIMEIGTRLVVVLEGRKNAIPSVVDTNGDPISDGDGPLLVSDLLPSAFEIVSSAFPLSGKAGGSTLDALSPRGDLRTVFTDSGRWIGLVVPESERADRQNAPQNPTANKFKVAAAEDDVEFRRAYLVRLNLAGRFSLPPISVERSVPPIKTFMSSRSSVQVKVPESFTK